MTARQILLKTTGRMLELSHVECEHEQCYNAFPLVVAVEEVGDDQVVSLVAGFMTVMVLLMATKRKQFSVKCRQCS